jgi:uncharacterized membrane protein YfcA
MTSAVRREFFTRVLPIALGLWAAGVAVSYLQHGFLIGGEHGVPVAGPECHPVLWHLLLIVPVAGPECHPVLWHLLLIAFIAGYSMALVGGATGLVSLPYDMSVFRFTTISVSATVQLETFINPFGALLGFRRSGQWNLDFALPLCAGAAGGALLGPVIRTRWLANATPFKAAVGIALIFVSIQMLARVFASRAKPKPAVSAAAEVTTTDQPMTITTVARGWRWLVIAYGSEQWRMSVPSLVALGALVGVIGTTLGVGGGFLLVPILVEFYGLPMRVIVAASIPFVIVLSAVGLFSFNVTVPLLTGVHVPTEWAWGFFTGGAALLGAWSATHSQRHIPEWLLRGVLGVCNGAVGVLYVLGYFGLAPIRI